MKIPKFILNFAADTFLSYKPMFFLYKPKIHLLKGYEIRQVINILKPGDILLRSYKGYMNAVIMNDQYSHAGLYIDDNTVIHSVREGAVKEDILDFCRADCICVIETIAKGDPIKAIEIANGLLGVPYDYAFDPNDVEFYCTELVDKCYDHIYQLDYKRIAGKMVLTPDAVRFSPVSKVKIEFRH